MYADELKAGYKDVRARLRGDPTPPRVRLARIVPSGPAEPDLYHYAQPIGPQRIAFLVTPTIVQSRPAAIVRTVARHYGMHINDVIGPYRHAQCVFVRHVAMYLCRRYTLRSYPQIGKAFSNRDHTTVMHGVRRIAKLIKADEALRDELQFIARSLGYFEPVEMALLTEGP